MNRLLKLGFAFLFILSSMIFFAVGEEGAAQPQSEPGSRFKFDNPYGLEEGFFEEKRFLRGMWFFEPRTYPERKYPHDAKERALRQINKLKDRARQEHGAVVLSRSKSSNPLLFPQALVQGPTAWESNGPAPTKNPLSAAYFGVGPVSGRIPAIAVDPGNPDHWFIGGASGGIWETTDAGLNWVPRTDDQGSLAMGAIAFAPSNPSIVYAGTGEAFWAGFPGAGLLKSVDGGTTWQLMGETAFSGNSFSEIRVDPANPNVVVAASLYPDLIIRSFLATAPPAAPDGIYKSTDGGVSWSLKISGAATDVEVHPGNFNQQYSAIGYDLGSWPGNSPNDVYRSTDGGENWATINGPWQAYNVTFGVGRIELAISPTDPNVLYVAVEDPPGSDEHREFSRGNNYQLLGIWKTTNAWDPSPAWVSISRPPYAISFPDDQLDYDFTLQVDPSDSNIFYFGGIWLWKNDNGVWSNISFDENLAYTTKIHVDQHMLASAGNRLIVGNDGGLYSTTDRGSTWTNHNTNLQLTQFYEGSTHPMDLYKALGGTQDNGTGYQAAADDWRVVLGGDGGASEFASGAPPYFYSPDTHWAASYQRLSIRRTVNGGSSFTVGDSGIDKSGVPFVARFDRCPANDDVFIAGTNNLWRTDNFFTSSSPSWFSNSPEIGAQVPAMTFAPSDVNCNTYAFGAADGQLFLTQDGGITWTNLDPQGLVPDRHITDLAFHPSDPQTLFVTLSGFLYDVNGDLVDGQGAHVYKTNNALEAAPVWVDITPPVNIPHNSVIVSPTDPNIVYIATDLGVWQSNNSGGTWTHLGAEDGLPNASISDLKPNASGGVTAFTYGRGSFYSRGKFPQVITEPATNIASDTATLNGSINPQGLPVSGWFEWGAETSPGAPPTYNQSTPAQDMGSGSLPVSINEGITGLIPGTVYHFRAVAKSGSVVYYGGDQTFLTLSGSNAEYISEVDPLDEFIGGIGPGVTNIVVRVTRRADATGGTEQVLVGLTDSPAVGTLPSNVISGCLAPGDSVDVVLPYIPDSSTDPITLVGTLTATGPGKGKKACDADSTGSTFGEGAKSFTNLGAAPPSPDLAMPSISASVSSAVPADSFVVTDVVANLGDGDAGSFDVGLYLSHFSINVQAGRDVLINTRTLAALAGNTVNPPFDSTVTIPSNIKARVYYIGGIADINGPYPHEVSESNENNNYAVGNSVEVRTGADLRVQSLSMESPSVRGQTSSLTYDVCNIGTGASSYFHLLIELSNSNTSNSHEATIGNYQVAHYDGLAAGQCTGPQTKFFTVPAVKPKTYYLWAIADGDGVIPETDEGNNITVSSPVEITK